MICEWCGTSFTPAERQRGKPRKFCSPGCNSASANKAMRDRRRALRPTKCAECDGVIAQQELGTPRRFCSDACKARHHNRRNRRAWLPLMQPTLKNCANCGSEFLARSRDRIYCYDGYCGQKAYKARKAAATGRMVTPHDVTCDGCGTVFTGNHPSARWCSKQCANRYWGGVRARQRGTVSAADYTDREVFERDGWRCHICGEQVDRDAVRTHPDGATIDHIHPISRGGRDELSNVATAHWRCNLDKRAK